MRAGTSRANQDRSIMPLKIVSLLEVFPVLQYWFGVAVASIWARLCDSWCPEILATILSAACTIAIGAVLINFNHGPDPFTAYGLTINTIVSILATTSKSALMFVTSSCVGQLKWVWFNENTERNLHDGQIFDDASRGPLGAITFVCSTSRRSIASLGALIILLALAFDPFVQRMVNFEPVSYMVRSSEAQIYRATHMFLPAASLDNMYTTRGLFEQSPLLFNASCPATDCNWDALQSVSWCRSCQNNTKWTVGNDCNVSTIFDGIYLQYPGDAIQPTPNYTNNECVLTSDDGRNFTINWVLYISAEQVSTSPEILANITIDWPDFSIQPSADLPWISPLDDERWSVANGPPPVYEFENMLARFDNTRVQLDSFFPQLTIASTRCSIDFCVNTYNVSTNKGSIKADVISSKPMKRSAQKLETSVFARNESSLESTYTHICWEDPGQPSTNFSNPTKWAGAITNGTNATVSAYVAYGDTTFCLSEDALGDWWVSLLSEISGSDRSSKVFSARFNQSKPSNQMTHGPKNGPGAGRLLNIPHNLVYELVDSGSYVDAPFVAVIRDHGPAKSTEDLAVTLTQFTVNTTANQQGTASVVGQKAITAAYIQVLWVWLTLPVALTLSGTAFLVITMVLTSRSNTPLWKSSLNALLYHGLDHPEPTGQRELNSVREMNEQACRTRAKLNRCGGYSRIEFLTSVSAEKHSGIDKHG